MSEREMCPKLGCGTKVADCAQEEREGEKERKKFFMYIPVADQTLSSTGRVRILYLCLWCAKGPTPVTVILARWKIEGQARESALQRQQRRRQFFTQSTIIPPSSPFAQDVTASAAFALSRCPSFSCCVV